MDKLNFRFRRCFDYGLSIICILLMGACGGKNKSMFPFGWSSTGQHSDTLLVQMDRALMSYADPSLLDSLVNEYCIVSEKEDPDNKYASRRLYWRGNNLFMRGDYETGDSLRRLALTECDSSMFPRDYRLYRMATEQPSDFPDNASRYRRYRDDLKVFISSGDMVSGFTRAVQLSGLMSEAGLTKEALEYAVLSDSLLAKAGLSILRTNNRVNIASAFASVGDTVRAAKELHTVRDSVLSYSIPSIGAIVDYNLFQLTGDLESLNRAWATVTQFEELAKMRALVASSIINSENTHIADPSELNESLELSSDYDYSPAELLEISSAILQDANKNGNIDKIKEATKDYRNAVENYIESQHKGEVIAAQTSDEIRKVEERERYAREIIHTRVWIGIAISTMILALVGIFFYRYVERQKRSAVLNQLESERLRRDILAKELMIVEKQILNENLQKKVEDLIRERKVERKTAEAISSIIESTNSKRTIEQEDAEFLKTFIEKYPKVSKTGRKIAMYIRKGLGTADIAKEMNIRKESVIQARWRLRSQMDLPNDRDLDIELRKG